MTMKSIEYIDVAVEIEKHSAGGEKSKYILLPFYKEGKPVLSGKRWGMTLLAAPSMRFRWNEVNNDRKRLLASIAEDVYNGDNRHSIVSLELIHSKTVYRIEKAEDMYGLMGDGMITDNPLLVPVVTVSDCVPIYFYDSAKGVFGVAHSGWKGTGIIGEALRIAMEDYGCRACDISVAIGPHIGSECYCVDKERRDYFADNFGDCVRKIDRPAESLIRTSDGRLLEYSLSLTRANLFVIRKAGVPDDNIAVARDCTCCSRFSDGSFVFGSFRRQAAFLPAEVDAGTRSRSMTVQAAFIV